jgi:membrane protein required for colicin V production
MQFTYIDAIVAAVTLLSGFLAYSRGLTREVFAIGGWILAAVVAFYLAPPVAPLVAEIPWLGQKLADSCLILMIIAFSLCVAVALLILAVFTPIFASVILESALGPIDRVLGFLFGIARGLLLVAVAYLVYQSFAGEEEIPALENAASRGVFDEAAALIDEYRPREMPDWLGERIAALTAPCEGEAVEEPAVPAPAPGSEPGSEPTPQPGTPGQG